MNNFSLDDKQLNEVLSQNKSINFAEQLQESNQKEPELNPQIQNAASNLISFQCASCNQVVEGKPIENKYVTNGIVKHIEGAPIQSEVCANCLNFNKLNKQETIKQQRASAISKLK